MKRLITIFFTAVFFFTIITAFNHAANNRGNTITQRQGQRLDDLIRAINKLQATATTLADSTGIEKLKTDYAGLRRSFKRWEYLGEYLAPVLTKDLVNGAPLPKIERNSFGLNVLQPTGLQVIDEIVYSNDVADQKDELVTELRKLSATLNELRNTHGYIYDRIVLEAVRTEIIRILTLGFTGFDVPGSGNSVNDAITVCSTMREDLDLFSDLFMKTDATAGKRVYANLDGLVNYLEQHNNFDSLDRLQVLTQYLNPLYADLLLLHKGSGIETINEALPDHLLPPYNYMSANIFANDFLDPLYYIKLPRELYNSETIALGRTLFFDPILSVNNQRSCAGCHSPAKAFTDGQPKSVAMDFDGTVDRNAPTLINCVYSERFFHDMRSEALEDQVEHVLVNRKEFNTDMMRIIGKLRQSDEYETWFEHVFSGVEGEKISNKTITFALSAYVSSLRGFNSAFDKYVRAETDHIDPAVRNGFNLFMGKAACCTCHFAPVFNGTVPPRYEETESEVLGVPADPYVKKPVVDPDEGRSKARLKEGAYFYQYSFKTPTVRNVALTAPYMHNGAYKTLEDVMDFYNKGGGKGIGIIIEHQTLPFDSLSLKKQEINDIIAFMKSLTDTAGMTGAPKRLPRFGDAALNNRKIGGEY